MSGMKEEYFCEIKMNSFFKYNTTKNDKLSENM